MSKDLIEVLRELADGKDCYLWEAADRIEQLERELEHANGTIDDLRAQVKRQAEMLRSHSESIHPNFDAWWDSDKSSTTPNTYKGWEESCRQAWYAAIDALKAQSEPVAWRVQVGDSNIWGYVENESDADFHGKLSGLKYKKQSLYTTPQPSAEDAKAKFDTWKEENWMYVELVEDARVIWNAAIDAARGEGK